jgi:Undecaprenyl-phosphate glucose phosphotransferase
MMLGSVGRKWALERAKGARAARRIPDCLAGAVLGACEALILFGSGTVAVGPAAYLWQAVGARHDAAVGFGALVALNLIWLCGGYRARTITAIGASLGRSLGAWAATVALLYLVARAAGVSGAYEPEWFVQWSLSAAAGLAFVRALFYLMSEYWDPNGRAARRVAVVGCGAEGQSLLAHYATERPGDVDIVGVFEDRVSRAPQYCWTYPVLGNLDALIEFVHRERLDDIVIALPLGADERLREMLAKLRVLPVDVSVAALSLEIPGGELCLQRIGGIPVVPAIRRPLTDRQLVLKEIEDRVLGAAILMLIAPVLALVAIAIKLDSPGPVLFRQMRYGYNNRLIPVLKFRTMRSDLTDADAERLTTRGDPRVTRVGRFLRKTSLDELPQFINVLRGEMSIVGPRPHARAAKAGDVLYPAAVEAYAARHKVKPGITGLAQIRGWRGETRTIEQLRQRVAHDMIYIRNWSLWLDLKIIAITAFTGFSSRDAY